MKTAIFALLLSFAASTFLPAETIVSGSQNSRDFDPGDAQQVETLAVALLISCDSEAPADVATEARWKESRAASYIHLTFIPPRNVKFTFSGRFTTGPASEQTVQVVELLIPISATKFPDYIFLRDSDKIRAFAKYRPTPAQALQDMLKAR